MISSSCTCLSCNSSKLVLNVSKIRLLDPTRTFPIQKAFTKAFEKRLTWLNKLLVKAIREDVLGIGSKKEEPEALVQMSFEDALAKLNKYLFPFQTSSGKIEGFMDWLKEMEDNSILEVVHRPGVVTGGVEAWSDVFLRRAYEAGISDGKSNLKSSGYKIPQETVEAAFRQPFHAERVGLIYTRVFNELKGISSDMGTKISRILAEGMASGANPKVIAREMTRQIEGINDLYKNRARAIARTEVVRANHLAKIQEYRQAGVEGVSVQAEWLTAGFNVCPVCQAFSGRTFTLDQIEPMIPAHPNCRCTAKPVLVREAGVSAKRSLS